MRSTIPRLGAVFVSLGLVLAACGGTASSGSQGGEPSGSAGSWREGRRFTGSAAWALAMTARSRCRSKKRSSAAFNESHPDIELVARDRRLRLGLRRHVGRDRGWQRSGHRRTCRRVRLRGLPRPVAGPDRPDRENDYDLSQFSQGSVEFYNVGGEGQVGLPFAIYPSMLYYHRDAFDEAGLEYPPHAYGEPYMLDGEEVEWNMDTMWELAKRLTVDVNGNDATSPDFDPTKIEQYGYEPPFQDLRAVGSYYRSWQPGGRRQHDGPAARRLARCLGRPLRERPSPTT